MYLGWYCGFYDRLSLKIWVFIPVIHHFEVFSKNFAQSIFPILSHGSMQFFVGFLKMNSEFWYRVISVYFWSKYSKKVTCQKPNFSCANFLASCQKAIKRSLLSSFVENSFLYLLRRPAPQTVESLLRKSKNTETLEFWRKNSTFWGMSSVFGP